MNSKWSESCPYALKSKNQKKTRRKCQENHDESINYIVTLDQCQPSFPRTQVWATFQQLYICTPACKGSSKSHHGIWCRSSQTVLLDFKKNTRTKTWNSQDFQHRSRRFVWNREGQRNLWIWKVLSLQSLCQTICRRLLHWAPQCPLSVWL